MKAEQEDILISRIVDGFATDSEWNDFESRTEERGELWRELAMSFRDQTQLIGVVDRAASIARRVDLDKATHEESPLVLRFPVVRGAASWGGWLVAALLAIVVAIPGLQLRQTAIPNPNQQAEIIPISSAQDALQEYLTRGKQSGMVIGEIPEKLLLKTSPVDSGDGYEVYFVRQLLERTVVPDLYYVGSQDEAGRPSLVRYVQPTQDSM